VIKWLREQIGLQHLDEKQFIADGRYNGQRGEQESELLIFGYHDKYQTLDLDSAARR